MVNFIHICPKVRFIGHWLIFKWARNWLYGEDNTDSDHLGSKFTFNTVYSEMLTMSTQKFMKFSNLQIIFHLLSS